MVAVTLTELLTFLGFRYLTSKTGLLIVPPTKGSMRVEGGNTYEAVGIVHRQCKLFLFSLYLILTVALGAIIVPILQW